jgi:uncharacterized membrane protein YfcA
MEPYILILLIIICFMVSLFGSVVGFGGGIFMVPILITAFHFNLATAVGAVMISLIPSSLLSTYLNRKSGNVDFKMGILLEIPTMVGVVIGTFLLSYISAKRLELLFATMVFFLGLSFFIKFKKTENTEHGLFYKMNKLKPRFIIKNKSHFVAYRASIWMVSFFGLLAGSLAGLFGIGGGFLKTPIMIKVFKMPVKIATATALFMIVITSTTGSISHYFQGNIDIEKAWPIILGFTLGAIAGQKMHVKANPKLIENLIGIGLIIAAAIMVFNLFFNP